MVRSAAKNHASVTIVTDPADYARLIAEMDEKGGATSYAFRRQGAAKAYAATAEYDGMIANWFAFADQQEMFPASLPVPLRLANTLRYGENPHQSAALYLPVASGGRGIGQAEQVQGKELSYNNLNDADAALGLVAEFRDGPPTVVIVKHANPCGVATGETLIEAYRKRVRVRQRLGVRRHHRREPPARRPDGRGDQRDLHRGRRRAGCRCGSHGGVRRKKNLRLLLTGDLPDPARPGLDLKTIAGGVLVQSRDNGHVTRDDLKIVTKRAPSERELADCLFAWTIAKHVKSNAIVYAKDGVSAGIGAGQMNRRDSARIAAIKAREAAESFGWAEPHTIGSAVASDAFFPFPDGLLAAAEAGATAVIQPGGSLNDDKVIAAADEAGLAMVFTGMRHFRH